MCFLNTSKPKTVVPKEPKVDRKQANASLTKNSINPATNLGYRANVKTSYFGLSDHADVGKSTLLGD